jgi:membrane-associated phospholipid phosphatase
MVAYLAFTSVIAVARMGAQPATRWVLLANVLTGCLILLASRPRVHPAIRDAYPIILLAAFYSALDILNSFGAVAVHDRTVQRWETHLFGAQLSRVWWQRYPSPFWSTVLHGAYFGYYLILLIPVVGLLLLRRYDAARRAVLWLMTTLLLCFAFFLLFPVAGPYYEFPRPSAAFLANPAAQLVYSTLANGSAYGAAFPSSHVAATLVATVAAFRGSRVLGWILILPAALLTVGVVYCQMHYAVDALAGLAVGAIVAGAGSWLESHGGRAAAHRNSTPA